MESNTAGDPMSGLKWTRKSTSNIAQELCRKGVAVCANTVGKLLQKMNFSLRCNYKKNEPCGKTAPKDRNAQFEHISKLSREFELKGNPVISVDTKKKELIGNFKNNGKAYGKEPELVNAYDFPSSAEGKAAPYGIFDVRANLGFVYVGTNKDTPSFAVDSIEKWWREIGKYQYRNSSEILILADGGGSNSSRSRVWKYELYQQICKKHRIKITVCHYPPGCSKWNPIEHRLFSAISKNWEGVPLRTYETVVNYIKTTRNSKGLRVDAVLVDKKYETGRKLENKVWKSLPIIKSETLPQWNYALSY